MKLNEIINEATQQDYIGCDADSILAKAQIQRTARPRYSGIKKVILIAAAICLVVGSISAATILGGFETAFGHKIDTGHVEILSSSTDNPDVVWNITETWFDEYNLQIGGTVITPEPLDPAGDYRIFCYFRSPGEELWSGILNGHIFQSNTCESAFILSSNTSGRGDGTFKRPGFEDDEITLELKFCWFIDDTKLPHGNGPYYMEDFEVIPGKWEYTVKMNSSDDQNIAWNGISESQHPEKSKAVITSVTLNAFTMEIKGEFLPIRMDSSTHIIDASIGVWLKLKDGSMIGKESGIFANTENRIEHRKETEDSLLLCFEKAIDLNEVESVILFSDWLTIPASGEDLLIRDGFEYYPVSSVEEHFPVWNGHNYYLGDFDEENRFEGWIPVMEIPLG